jgi:putative acetyltransferase
MQSHGIGKALLNYAKNKRNKLFLNVYQKNIRAIAFYQREGFEIQHSSFDEATEEKEYVMKWQQK